MAKLNARAVADKHLLAALRANWPSTIRNLSWLSGEEKLSLSKLPNLAWQLGLANDRPLNPLGIVIPGSGVNNTGVAAPGSPPDIYTPPPPGPTYAADFESLGHALALSLEQAGVHGFSLVVRQNGQRVREWNYGQAQGPHGGLGLQPINDSSVDSPGVPWSSDTRMVIGSVRAQERPSRSNLRRWGSQGIDRITPA
ncbi:MAG: hypothetical protein ABSE49_27240 [Polyangiaceae bacterium]|jgi:hypothetical protein